MHNHHPVIPYVSLCSGYEGIGLGLHRCIPNLRAVAYCEREAFAVANLVAKMENGLLGAAPIFADVRTFPWSSFTRLMAGGILSFGWPCQPVSVAGQRKAVDDERWLFDIIADGIAIMRPGILFAENVEGLLSAKMPDGSSVFGHCVQRLESLHYRVAAGIFSASEVGAPHQRKRVFIMAVASGFRSAPGLSGSFPRDEGQSGESNDGGCEVMANASSQGPQRHWGKRGHEEGGSQVQVIRSGCSAWPSRPGERQYGWEPPRVVGNTGCERQEERQVEAGGSEQSDEVRDMADSGFIGSDRRPDGSCGWSRESGEAGVDATGCGSEGDGMRQAQPPLGRDFNRSSSGLDYAELCVSCDNRTDELRLLGNGVVPATAERAFRTLIKELL